MKAVNHGARVPLLLVAGIVAGSLTSVRLARADAACIAAYEQTQTLRKDGKPVAAKVQASICAKETCPALLTKDCTRWLAELDTIVPTVVLDPRGPSGGLRADVRVKLDGTLLSEKIDGRAIVVEPGSHTFVFEAEGAAPAVRTLLVREGEKNKKITVTLAPPVEAPTVERPIPLGVWLFGGASILAVATSAAFALDGLAKKSDLDQCKPRCSPDAVDAMSMRFTFADVALGAGVMAGAAAFYLLLTRTGASGVETTPPLLSATRPVPFAAPLARGAAFGVSARF